MPTYDEEYLFWRDWERLSANQQAQFQVAVGKMVDDPKAGQNFRKGFRIKSVQGHDGIFEMTWAPDGRATFRFGEPINPGEKHVIWRRIGGHEILAHP